MADTINPAAAAGGHYQLCRSPILALTMRTLGISRWPCRSCALQTGAQKIFRSKCTLAGLSYDAATRRQFTDPYFRRHPPLRRFRRATAVAVAYRIGFYEMNTVAPAAMDALS